MLSKYLRIHAVVLVACVFMILYPLYNEKPDSEKTEQAASVAAEFLQLLDNGQYAESWSSSAELMKDRVTEKDWVEKLTKARTASGELLKRERKSASFSTEAQDSPEGEYIMLTFNSRCQKADDGSEYVTVMLDVDRWRVAGYFMQE